MLDFAIGPVSGTALTVQQVLRVGLQDDLPDLGTGQQAVNVDALVGDDPLALVGRMLDITDPAAPALIAAPDRTIAETREYLKSRYRVLEAVPGLQAWNILSTDFRAGAYTRWVWNNAAASSIDANLASVANRYVLTREADFSGPTWYIRSYLEQSGSLGLGGAGISWDDNLGITGSPAVLNRNPAWVPTVYYPTVESSASTPNSWGWTSAATIRAGAAITFTGLAADWDPREYLHG